MPRICVLNWEQSETLEVCMGLSHQRVKKKKKGTKILQCFKSTEQYLEMTANLLPFGRCRTKITLPIIYIYMKANRNQDRT